MRTRTLSIGLLVVASLAVIVLAFSPILVLALPNARWKRHVYEELSFDLIAQTSLPHSRDPDTIIAGAVDYTRRHLWLFDNSRPYDGRALDYLVEGVGWCDYYAKVLCKLLAARGIHARYAFLQDQHGSSPHTIAEVYVRGQWRALDPFFNLSYVDGRGEWLPLETITPEVIDNLPDVALLKQVNQPLYENISEVAQQTFPLPRAPQRSDDFLAEKHPFDWMTAVYVRLFGARFAGWFQDQYLPPILAAIPDPIDRIWYRARHYHLYRRSAEAEPLYRALLADPAARRYHERTALFFCRLLMREQRYAEAIDLLQAFSRQSLALQTQRWLHFHLAKCYDLLNRRDQAIVAYQTYQRLQGRKYSVEAVKRLATLRNSRL